MNPPGHRSQLALPDTPGDHHRQDLLILGSVGKVDSWPFRFRGEGRHLINPTLDIFEQETGIIAVLRHDIHFGLPPMPVTVNHLHPIEAVQGLFDGDQDSLLDIPGRAPPVGHIQINGVMIPRGPHFQRDPGQCRVDAAKKEPHHEKIGRYLVLGKPTDHRFTPSYLDNSSE